MPNSTNQTAQALPQQRRFMHPQVNDTWVTIAAREMSGQASDETVAALQSWNLHVFMKPGGVGAAEILPCDVVFLEPPKAA